MRDIDDGRYCQDSPGHADPSRCEACGRDLWQHEWKECICSTCADAENERERREAEAELEAEALHWQALLRTAGQAANLVEDTVRRWQAYAASDGEMAARARELVEAVRALVKEGTLPADTLSQGGRNEC